MCCDKKKIAEARLRLLRLMYEAHAGHAGSCFSCIDALTVIACNLGADDVLLLSKGHASGALYTAWCVAGKLSESELATFAQSPTHLGIHPPKSGFPFIPFATGSLGHGLSLAAGLALGRKMRGLPGRIYCVTGDGEWQEGACWEALTFAVRHHLDNLVAAVDVNGFQGFDTTENTAGYSFGGLAERIAAFGAEMHSGDGHDAKYLRTIVSGEPEPGRVAVHMLRTIKAHGLKFFENTFRSHYDAITPEQYASARADLEAGAAL